MAPVEMVGLVVWFGGEVQTPDSNWTSIQASGGDVDRGY
jgi:hypothetical protein